MDLEDQMANLSWGFLTDSFVNEDYEDCTDKAGMSVFSFHPQVRPLSAAGFSVRAKLIYSAQTFNQNKYRI